VQVTIHRLLDHKNIIKFYGVRIEDDIQYLFLQYASGGELFDKIGKCVFYLFIYLFEYLYSAYSRIMCEL
jgi:serine/threonine protein kinase